MVEANKDNIRVDIEKALSNPNLSERVRTKLLIVKSKLEGVSSYRLSKNYGHCSSIIRKWVQIVEEQGLDIFIAQKRGGNHMLLNKQQYEEFLAPFKARVQKGEKVHASEIKGELERRLGKKVSTSGFYSMLKRHNWQRPVKAEKVKIKPIDLLAQKIRKSLVQDER